MELEVGLHDGWMRYWLRGKLLALPAERERELAKARQALAEEQRALGEERRALGEERRARLAAEEEAARLRAEVERLKKAQTKRSGANGAGEPGA